MEICKRVSIIDVDLVFCSSVEEVVVEGKGGDRAGSVGCEGGDAVVGDGEVAEVLRREFLERWN